MKKILNYRALVMMVSSVFLSVGCSVFYPLEVFQSKVKVENESSDRLFVKLSLDETSFGDACEPPHFSETSLELEPNTSKEISVSLKCRYEPRVSLDFFLDDGKQDLIANLAGTNFGYSTHLGEAGSIRWLDSKGVIHESTLEEERKQYWQLNIELGTDSYFTTRTEAKDAIFSKPIRKNFGGVYIYTAPDTTVEKIWIYHDDISIGELDEGKFLVTDDGYIEIIPDQEAVMYSKSGSYSIHTEKVLKLVCSDDYCHIE